MKILVGSLLGIGVVGAVLMLIRGLMRIDKNKKPFGFLSSSLLIVFSGIILLSIFIGIDDIRGTKVTEETISKINTVVANFKSMDDGDVVENQEIESNEGDSEEDKNSVLTYNPPEQLETTEEVVNEEKNDNSGTENSTVTTSTESKGTSKSTSTENNNEKEGSEVSSEIVNTSPAEIVEYKLRDVGNHTTSLVYSIKNNSDKTIYTYKIVILLYDNAGNPVYVRSNDGISDNMIQEVHHDYNINPSETRWAIADIIKAENIKKVKIVISEVEYVGTSEIWVNPEINTIIQNRGKF